MVNAVLSLIVIAFLIYLLAIITDKFFIISLDKLATRLEMPSNVAGASLMAIGSSAPELSIALFAVLLGGSHGEIGIGTIVGSAVFNILVITGASAVVAGQLVIRNRSVERDVFFYLVSVLLLLIVFWNGEIVVWEALLMLFAYVVYLIVLWRWSNGTSTSTAAHHPTAEISATGEIGLINRAVTHLFGFIARNPAENYIWALLVSVAAIAGISFILVEAVIVFAEALHIPPVIVSLTLLAAGTSAPDLLASMEVAREGRGSMAIANAVGSNIFDVLIGLSVPWLVIMSLGETTVEVTSEGLLLSIFVLIGTVILLYFFLYTGRSFTRREGLLLIAAYVIYVLFEILTI